MKSFDSTIQEQAKHFRQRLAHHERRYRTAIAALAAEQMRQQLERRTLEPPRRRRSFSAPCRALARGVRQIVSFALHKRGKGPEVRSRSAPDAEPVIIDVDVVYVDPKPLDNPQSGAASEHRMPTGNRSERKEAHK